MAASTLTPYELLGANPPDNDLHLRLAYRARIHEFKEDRLKGSRNRKITAEKFRLICRSYETLSDYEKRERWINVKSGFLIYL
jgi:DnaJ-class molecular chaperone